MEIPKISEVHHFNLAVFFVAPIEEDETLRAVNGPHSTKFVSVPEEYLNEYVHDYVGVEKERRCSRIFLLIHMSIYSVTKVKEVNSNLFE